MKHSLLIFLLAISTVINSASSCDRSGGPASGSKKTESNNDNKDTMNRKIKISINSKTFTATLLDNNSAKALIEMLPMTIEMVELNGNEKFFDLSKNLPINSSNPGIIKNGDIMLYGSRTLVLFYKAFSTSYSYTKIGSVEDTAGLATALGSGTIKVVFEAD
ncbi:cyclophilin-like fold protein [Chitinophaga sp. MM2321]|uniref:cyclophilin-like fold protein n=1 Tax=Chitinophaga sp. MM2321 TaxID=3137178 RepID=UPI0032D59994